MKNVTFRLSHQDLATLKDFADSKNMTVSETLRDLIRSINSQKTFEARLLSFMKKIEKELGSTNGDFDTTTLNNIHQEMMNINKGLSTVLNRHRRNEWTDMNKIKSALYLLSTDKPTISSKIKNLFED